MTRLLCSSKRRGFFSVPIAVALILQVAAVPASSAPPPDSQENWYHAGALAGGQPAWAAGYGVSDGVAIAACLGGAEGLAPAIDGEKIALPEGSGGRRATLEFLSPVPPGADLRVLFYGADCAVPMDQAGSMYEAGRNEPEQGYVPWGATHAVVGAIEGVDITYTLTVFLSEPILYPAPGSVPESMVERFEVTRDDGTTLAGHVHRPVGRGGRPQATILDMNPYWNWSLPASDAPLTGPHRAFLAAGFAVARVNSRGSGLSGGCTQYGSPVEIRDVGSAIEALAAKEWSNGRVGMYGFSYGGWSAFMGVASNAPSLKAIAAIDGIIDPWTNVTLRGAGYVPQFGHIWRATHTAVAAAGGNPTGSSLAPTADMEARDCPDDSERWPPIWNGDRGEYWGNRPEEGAVGGADLRGEIKGTDVAVFAVNGLRPPGGVTAGDPHILQFEGLWDLLGRHRRLLLGQWGHRVPTAQRPELTADMVAWFHQHLRGGPPIVDSGVVEYEDEDTRWHVADRWPPAGNERTFHLSDGELVDDDKAVVASERSFAGIEAPCLRQCPDVEPTGTVNDGVMLPAAMIETCIGNHVDYVSAPLPADLPMAGSFRLDVQLQSTLPDGNLFAYLLESKHGACPDADARVLGRAVADLRHIPIVTNDGIENRERGDDFSTLQHQTVSLLSMPFAATARAGNRLILAIGGDGRETYLVPEITNPRITISTGGSAGSLQLPVMGHASPLRAETER